MTNIDLRYLCTTIGNLAGIPIRIFEDGTQTFYYSVVYLPKDPMELCRDEVFAISDHVGYFVTPQFHYYGVINSGQIKIVVGPTRQIMETDQELKELAFNLDLSGEDADAMISGMRSIFRMPMESILQMLCTMNYVLNDEKIELIDISIHEKDQAEIVIRQERRRAQDKLPEDLPQSPTEHNTYDLEQLLLRMVRKGDTASLKEWFAAAPAIRGGVVASEPLRQRKNLFIVTTTLASRAAIQGGMQINDAFTLSDSYIQQCELLTTPERITNLQYRMLFDYTERVERLRCGKNPSKLAMDVANYVQHHLSDAIKSEDIAKALYISRPYLSKKFKEDTGENIIDFILKEKTEEAKRLLRYSDKSLTAIGSYLGFSSASHFSRVFKTYVGVTPSEYREKHQ
jgi:YSIRK-targeted surface antigen transcriptional regulator